MSWLSSTTKKLQANAEARQRDRKEIKLARIAARAETKQTAYEHGIDPTKAAWEGAASLTGSVADVVGKVYGAGAMEAAGGAAGGLGDLFKSKDAPDQPQTQGGNKSMLIIVVLAVVAFLMFKK